MSMDHLRTVYVPPKRNGRKRTTYSLMTQWAEGAMQVTAIPTRPMVMPVMPCTLGNHRVATLNEGVQKQMPVHMQYGKSGGYDDAHKAYLSLTKAKANFESKNPEFRQFGPRLRNGRHSGSWRHIKNVLQAAGSRTCFVDGETRIEDNCKLIDRDDLPGSNVAQPSLTRAGITTGLRRTPVPKKRMHSGTGSVTLEAHQGMEKGNWTLMR